MATGESNLTPSASAGRIREPLFKTVRRGFDPDQVLEYLGRVGDHVEALESRVRQLESELAERDVPSEGQQRDVPSEGQALTGQDPYESVAARVAGLVRTFDQDVERLRQDAETDADRIVAEAKAEAERIDQEVEKLGWVAEAEGNRIVAGAKAEARRIQLDAQAKAEEERALAERTLHDAQAEADKVLSGLASRREALLDELRGMRDRVAGTLADLEAIVERGSAGGEVVIVEDAREGEPADAASLRSPEGRPDPRA